ncbi:EAL domain-containing protein [Porticoccus sp.]|uniref:EAL domain-containing protein n=1 Tax=Porticoccus sp. TaxID=2024853 RepID=UPI003F69F28F
MSIDIQSDFRPDALSDHGLENRLLNTQTVGVLLLDSRLVIRYWNQWLGEWTGMPPENVARRAFDSLFPALVGSPFAQAIDEALFQGVSTHWSQRANPDFLDFTESAMAGSRRELPLHRVSFTPLELPDFGHCCLVQIDEAPFDATPDKPAIKKEPERPVAGSHRFPAYLDTDQIPLLMLDSHHLIMDGNEALETLFGYSAEQLKNRPLRVLLPTINIELADNIKVALERAGGSEKQLTMEGATADGENLALRVSCFPSVTHRDCHVLLFQDMTLQSANLEALFHQRKLINAVFSQVVDGILLTDRHGLVEHLNPIGMELLGINDPQPNRYIDDLMTLLSESGDPVESPCRSALTRGKAVSVVDNTMLSVPGQQPFPVVASATPLRNRLNQITGTVLVFRSVSEARRVSTRLTWQATHDPLTQLANRRHLENEILKSIDAAHSDDSTHTLLYIDLYNFSVINDTCGHNAGDELLCQFARLLEKHAESRDVVARIGNDEFALLLNDRTVEESREVAEQLLWQIKEFSFPWEERRLKIGASIGAKVIDRNTVSEIDVLVAAGISCATAKEAGRNRINFQYRSVEVAERHSLAQWIPVITEALEEDRFVLYCQPIVPVASQDNATVRHYEVLVRMVDREGAIILPGKFIPAAEHYGLVEDIDRWVLNNIFAYLEKSTRPEQRFAVNLSGNTISDEGLKDYIIGKFDATGVSPSQLQFEVTETAAIRHFDRAMDLIHALRDLGCYFSLDDFGSGLSSLGYLKELPVDYLKIDGSFIRTMELNEVDYSMVSTINHLGHIMGIATIAECVENNTQLSMLQEIGVDYAQGFLIARPQPLARLS